MRASPLAPAAHLYVCTNPRPADDPLGEGCGARGVAAYEALRAEVSRRGLSGRVWVTRTLCQGLCPKTGACVSVAPGGAMMVDVVPGDAPALIAPFARG